MGESRVTTDTTCTYPNCNAQKTGERFCKQHLRAARKWLRQQAELDQIGEPADAFVTYKPAYPGGPTYPWADWDWDDPLHRKPEGLEDDGWDAA